MKRVLALLVLLLIVVVPVVGIIIRPVESPETYVFVPGEFQGRDENNFPVIDGVAYGIDGDMHEPVGELGLGWVNPNADLWWKMWVDDTQVAFLVFRKTANTQGVLIVKNPRQTDLIDFWDTPNYAWVDWGETEKTPSWRHTDVSAEQNRLGPHVNTSMRLVFLLMVYNRGQWRAN